MNPHTVDAFEYSIKAQHPELQKLRDKVGLTDWLAQYGHMPAHESQVTCEHEKMYQVMREMAETYALFPILWRYQGSDEVHEVSVNIKSHVIPWPASDKYNIGPGFFGEPDPVKEEVIVFPPQLVRQTMKRYRRLVLECQQMRFDSCIDRLRRAGRTRLATRRIVVDLVHHWPRRNGKI